MKLTKTNDDLLKRLILFLQDAGKDRFRLAAPRVNSLTTLGIVRTEFQQRIAAEPYRLITLDLRRSTNNDQLLEQIVSALAESNTAGGDVRLPVVEVLGLDQMLTTQILRIANRHRDQFALQCHCPLILWATDDVLLQMQKEAGDFQHWSLGQYEFEEEPVSLFISYSHRDKEWLDELLVHLTPLTRKGQVIAWTDREIRVGDDWRQEIDDALQRVQVAVLLVSQNFLHSNFVVEKELPVLLAAQKERGLPIVWVPISDCLLEEHPEIQRLQSAIDPAKPLDRTAGGNRNSQLKKVAKSISDAAKFTHGRDKTLTDAASNKHVVATVETSSKDQSISGNIVTGHDQVSQRKEGRESVVNKQITRLTSRVFSGVSSDRDDDAEMVMYYDERLEDLAQRVEQICRLKYAAEINDDPRNIEKICVGVEVSETSQGSGETEFAVIRINVHRFATNVIDQHRVIGVAPHFPSVSWLKAFVLHVALPHRKKHADAGQRIDVVYQDAGLTIEPEMETVTAEFAKSQAITLIPLTEYSGLLNFTNYRAARRDELSKPTGPYPPALYVDQKFDLDLPGHARKQPGEKTALEQLVDWVDDPHGRALLVLGTFGTGKSFLMRKLVLELLERRPYITPILVEIGKLDRQLDWSQLVAANLAAYRQAYDPDKFEYMLREGRIVLIFDGFDELVLRVTYQKALHHFENLLQAAMGQATVIITCRTEHFVSDKDVKQSLFHSTEQFGRHQFISLRKFEREQIREFLHNRLRLEASNRPDNNSPKTPEQTEADVAERLNLLDEIKDLMGLSETPRMLGFITDLSADELRSARDKEDGTISSATLYRTLISRWLRFEAKERNNNKPGDIETPDENTRFSAVRQLALNMWRRNLRSVNVADLGDAITEPLETVLRAYENPKDEGVHLLGSGALVCRTGDNKFEFLHQSVLEWLVADHVATLLQEAVRRDEAVQLLGLRELSPLMADFLNGLSDSSFLTHWTREILAARTRRSKQLIENILLLRKRLGIVNDKQSLDLSGRNLDGQEFTRQDLTGSDFRRTSLRNAVFSDCILQDCRFDDSDISGARFEIVDFTRATCCERRFIEHDSSGPHFARQCLTKHLSG